MPQQVMIYHSGMAGAPSTSLATLSGLIAVLDACLVNGFGTVSVSGITQVAGVATLTTTGSHNFSVGDFVDVSGADQAGYNGRVKVLAVPASNQFTYAVAGGTVSPATGTMSVQRGPAGWTKPYSSTNIAVYTTGAGSLGHSLQVEDNNPYADTNTSVRTRIVVGATGPLDSGTDLGEQCRICKATGPWVVVADHRTCYVVMNDERTLAFGEFSSYLVGDSYNFFQNRGANANSLYVAQVSSTFSSSVPQSTPGGWFPSHQRAPSGIATSYPATIIRAVSQLAGSVLATPLSAGISTSGSSNNLAADAAPRRQQIARVPSLADNAFPLLPEFLGELSGGLSTVRGRLRGIYFPLGLADSVSFTNNIYRLDDVVIGGVVRSIALVRMGYQNGAQIAFDLGETWD